MANNTYAPETFHEVPASKYWYLGDAIGAVPKGFFKFYTPFIIVATAVTTAIACLTDWWQIAFTRLATFIFVENWAISLPVIGFTSLVLYIRHNWKEKRKRKNQLEKERIRKYQNAVINQSERGETKK